MKNRLDKLTNFGTYKNSRQLNIGGVPFSVKDVVVTAPLIAGLNVYLVGGTGEGKTQLANDLAGLFGDSYCYAEGRPDFEPSELLKHMNLGKLKEAKSDRELVELTSNVNKALYYVDELNRCPPIVMNYFFNFFDGKLVHNGKVYRLGRNGYSVGFASGNLGDGEYVGTQDTDRALKDRMHMVVKLDDPQFCTTVEDDGLIFEGKRDPRATAPAEGNGSLDDILYLHGELGKREVPAILPALGIYLHKGLDYLENAPRHSKRVLDQVWPNSSGIRQDTDESKIMPLSKRSVLATISLSQALEMIAEARGHKVKDSTRFLLDALRFTVPYSGVLSKAYLDNEKSGDVYTAFDDVMVKTKDELIGTDANPGKKQDIEASIAFAQMGCKEEAKRLAEKICPTTGVGRWAPVRTYLESLANRTDDDQALTLDDLKKQLGK